MVASGGSYAHMRDVRGGGLWRLSRQTAVLLSASAGAVMAVCMLIAVLNSQEHEYVLAERAEAHDLHLANTLKDALNKGPDPSISESDTSGDDIHLGAKSAEMTTLAEARKDAEKRVRVIAARHQMNAAQNEELILKQKLDAETRLAFTLVPPLCCEPLDLRVDLQAKAERGAEGHNVSQPGKVPPFWPESIAHAR